MFEEFCAEKNDRIYNAAFDLLNALAGVGMDDRPLEWDMEQIGEVVDAAKDVLMGVHEVCHPFYEGDGEIPCYKGTDCANFDCPLRSKEVAQCDS